MHDVYHMHLFVGYLQGNFEFDLFYDTWRSVYMHFENGRIFDIYDPKIYDIHIILSKGMYFDLSVFPTWKVSSLLKLW